MEREDARSARLAAMATLAQRIGHDLNNALTAAVGFAGFALAEMDPPPDLRACLESLHRAAERASGLAQQLVAIHRRMARPESTQDMNAVVRDLGPLLRDLTEPTEIVLHLCAGEPAVLADEADLEQAVVALVRHARSHGQGYPIAVRTEAVRLDRPNPQALLVAGSYVAVSVSAREPGLTATLAEPLASSAEAAELGLELVFHVARKLGGSLERAAERSDRSTLRLLVPMSDEARP